MRDAAKSMGLALALTLVPTLAAPDARAGVEAAPASVEAGTVPASPSLPAPATEDETLDYARRESESPEVAEYRGGHHGFVVFLVFVAAVVIAIVLLTQKAVEE
jgi:hypothetical protein